MKFSTTYLPTTKNEQFCSLSLKYVSGSEMSRLVHDGNQQRSMEMFKIMAFGLNKCTQPGTPLINGFVDHVLCGTDRIMATRH